MKLPKVETLIIFVFLGCVALWAMSKCSSQRSEFVRSVRDMGGDDTDERPARRDTVAAEQPARQQPAQVPPAQVQPVQTQPVNTRNPSATPPAAGAPAPSAPAPQPGAQPTRPALSNQPAQTQAPASSSTYSTLYVSIEGLKVRKEPGLKSETVAKLALYEPVTFLNEKTKWTQEISLGYEKVTDHWVKVRTQSGKEGWVFGAGVHYYKTKRQGVTE
jgi:hypothetical protein